MKRSHIIALVVIAVGLAVVVSSISNSSTYADFTTASEHEGTSYHVVGKVNLEEAFRYAPEQNANLFGFTMTDNKGVRKNVLYNGTKPQDFERAEQIVVVGRMEGSTFQASQILMKCPSKYNGNEQDRARMGESAS
ncbi:MAG: cytochrome c maturation protein CcmE [Sphingobacteriales bacterium]|jgi:cytochrome c-type biogenesis protein CcmE|nr:cytochrome c maturation protein CcmE [Sphingobacteriales bacterium]